MNINELKELLSEMAEKDLVEGHDIYDHPCSVAIRALDQCFDDIEVLKKVVKNSSSFYSKRVQVLVKTNYKPEW